MRVSLKLELRIGFKGFGFCFFPLKLLLGGVGELKTGQKRFTSKITLFSELPA